MTVSSPLPYHDSSIHGSHVIDDKHDCTKFIYYIVMYLIHIGSHLLAVNYLLVFILFKDAQENSDYMIDDVRGWTDINLILTCIMFYSIVNIQAIYLSCHYSRHILPCVVCAMFYGLCYLVAVLDNIDGCADRELLSCPSGTVVSNRIIDISIVLIYWALLALTAWVCVYILSIVVYNFKIQRIYYFSLNCFGEICMLFLSYYFTGALIFGLPIFCACLFCGCGACGCDGSESGTGSGTGSGSGALGYGNVVNGTSIDCTDIAIV